MRTEPRSASARRRGYSVAALFHELDGQTFLHYDELVDVVLALINTHLSEFPPSYRYEDALALAEAQDWLASADGRTITVVCPAPAAETVELLAA